MKCPFCQNPDTRVIDSRSSDDDFTIRRRRICEVCQKRFTTYEKIETIPLMVSKKDGSIEPFDREKLIEHILRACSKRPIALKDIEDLADSIEQKGQNSLNKQEISSVEIGEMVMEGLRKLDEVAYVRFASVYRQFTDVDTFMNELQKIKIAGGRNN